jgi:hypothetical protein
VGDAPKRRFDVVAVWKFDRFARSVTHLLRALETFRVLGIEFEPIGVIGYGDAGRKDGVHGSWRRS